jgi:hypothetical protein
MSYLEGALCDDQISAYMGHSDFVKCMNAFRLGDDDVLVTGSWRAVRCGDAGTHTLALQGRGMVPCAAGTWRAAKQAIYTRATLR